MRIYGLLIALALLPLATWAQFYMGPSYSYLLSADYMRPLDNQTLVHSAAYGISIKHFNQKTMGLQIDLNYASKGWDEFRSDDFYMKGDAKFVEMRMFTHARMLKGPVRLSILAGPYLAYLTEVTEDRLIDGKHVQQTFIFADEFDFRTEFGLVFGLALVFETKIGDIQTSMSYPLGFSTLTARISADEYDYRINQALGITISLHPKLWQPKK